MAKRKRTRQTMIYKKLMLFSVQQICNVLRAFQSTVKPVLRGYHWDKAKVVF